MNQTCVPSQILDIDNWVDVAYSLGISFHEQNGCGQWWSRKTAIRFVHLLIQDIVANQLIWLESSDVAHEFLKRSFEIDIDNEQSDQLITHFDSIEVYIREKITDCFCDNPWWIWRVHYHKDYIILESQGDYRIHVFHHWYGDQNHFDVNALPVIE